MIDLKAIRAAAEAAPQDRLHVRHDFGAYYSLRHYPGDYYQGRIRGKERAEYIATANPATILELLDRLEAAEAQLAATRLIQPVYLPLPEDRENGCKPFDPQARIQELEGELRDQRIAAAVRGMK